MLSAHDQSVSYVSIGRDFGVDLLLLLYPGVEQSRWTNYDGFAEDLGVHTHRHKSLDRLAQAHLVSEDVASLIWPGP